MAVEIITTEDGSHSLFNSALKETYHSVHGAIQESTHVFINAGLDFLIKKSTLTTPINILEVGFGTGLNALLTIQHTKELDVQIQYTTLETFPLPETIWSNLNYATSDAARDHFKKLHHAPWETWQPISQNFDVLKLNSSLETAKLQRDYYHLIFFDAFAPSKQPEMWQYSILENVANSMKPGGIYVTYCAKGQLKRDLRNLGLSVEALPGPPGKMEMVRAQKAC